ncbi:His-Xaa-Ser system radical SAM maturase HxsB [Alcaligenaceae bacterium B3P038]|nr:His-Xaa-Ser system radical SAM maturase HxsB [Alcaligenaceae bacterium B3P038]
MRGCALNYRQTVLPYKVRALADGTRLGISSSGDFAFLSPEDLSFLDGVGATPSLERLAELQSRFFVSSSAPSSGTRRLLRSRKAAKREAVQKGPALHIIVPTLQCDHSCQYCQVSRSLEDVSHTISDSDLRLACDSIFQSGADSLTVEFQGGDPLLRFDLVKKAIVQITERNAVERRRIRFVVASTLHQLNREMCEFFSVHGVYLSTSIDGPQHLHDRNRPIASRDAYAKTMQGVLLAREMLGHDSVSALMTSTKLSLSSPTEIVDEYVRLGFQDIFIRPLSSYGFAKRNQATLGYSIEDFRTFYQQAFERVLYWNNKGVKLREVYASILLNKILSSFDSGYVDLQSTSGAGIGALVYNYDGYVYPSDEARMLGEMGDHSLRLGRIGDSLTSLLHAPIQRDLIKASLVDYVPGCRTCAYNQFCAPNPVDAQAQFGSPFAPVALTEHCQRHLWMFDFFYTQLRVADETTLDLFYDWAAPTGDAESS